MPAEEFIGKRLDGRSIPLNPKEGPFPQGRRWANYSRNDIVSYKLYLLNSKTCYSISKSDFNI